jgi:hypothetical protein
MVRQELVDDEANIDFDAINLRYLFGLTIDDTICFLARVGALKNLMFCDKCESRMNVQKKSELQDGILVGFVFINLNIVLVGLSWRKKKVLDKINPNRFFLCKFESTFADFASVDLHVGI